MIQRGVCGYISHILKDICLDAKSGDGLPLLRVSLGVSKGSHLPIGLAVHRSEEKEVHRNYIPPGFKSTSATYGWGAMCAVDTLWLGIARLKGSRMSGCSEVRAQDGNLAGLIFEAPSELSSNDCGATLCY